MAAKNNAKGVSIIAWTLLLAALNIAFPSCGAAADFRCVTGKVLKTTLPGGMQEYRCMSTNSDGSLVQVGSYVLKYEDGSYSVRASFKNGEPHGMWRSFYRNGQINEEGAYYLGHKVGVWRKWSADGRLETLEEFQ